MKSFGGGRRLLVMDVADQLVGGDVTDQLIVLSAGG